MPQIKLSENFIKSNVKLALNEDLYPSGDITSGLIKNNNIILDPGIGFGKNLKHNITLLKNISIFHSLGLPIMLGLSRKRFIKDISNENDTTERLGGTISSCIHSYLQGVQILRVHDVNEVIQSIKIFKELLKK